MVIEELPMKISIELNVFAVRILAAVSFAVWAGADVDGTSIVSILLAALCRP